MTTNWYKEVLEALNMKKRKNIVHNQLNKAATKSNDSTLRALTKDVIDGLSRSSTNTENIPLAEFNSVKTKALIKHCERLAYPDRESK